MAIKFGKAEIDNLKKRAEGAMNRMRSIREKAEEGAGHVIQTITIGATSFGFGYLNGRVMDERTRTRGYELFGVPVELISGLGLHVLGFMGTTKYAEHLHNIGDGAIASYVNTLGAAIGDKMRLEARNQPATAALPASANTASNVPISSGSPAFRSWSDAELQALAARR